MIVALTYVVQAVAGSGIVLLLLHLATLPSEDR